MKYKKRIFEPADRAIISSGRIEKDKYILDIAPNGSKKLIKNGVQMIDDEIQSHAHLCDVKEIVKRFTMSGEADKLVARGAYVDLTQMPKNLAEVHSILNKGKSVFDNLPKELQGQFASYDDFLANFGSLESINAFLDTYIKKDEQSVTDKEVKSDETQS